ncbi:MAG: malto-oligosyltrehalose synthase [Deltaproteobacteria bacterium]|nr:malto-oligosyltrehalose synthase [Deltaproteobacteria bacterium]
MTATYRLQLHAGFTFSDVRELVPYFAELGITHLYLSPILQAAEGSTHGYDVVDPSRASPVLGGELGLDLLAGEALRHGLALLVDIVPNHMSIAGTTNRWWVDVLENGPASYYAHYFDVDWRAGEDRVTLPVLGERYGRALVTGRLGLVHDGAGGFEVRAGDLRLPMAPESRGTIVRRAGERARRPELAYLGDALAELPRDVRLDERATRRRRHRDKAVIEARLRELCKDAACASAIDAEVAAVNADRVELDAALEAQPYRLVHWSVSTSELTYRRFFDINTLVGLHMEDADVFDASHERILAWLADGTIAGVRIDHVDGLRDPGAYLTRLRELAPNAWIVVEKILGREECIPAWPIDGSTGYDFLDRVTGLLVDPAGEAALTAAFEAYAGAPFDPEGTRRAARRLVAGDVLHSEVARLVELAARACASSPACRDFTRREVEQALVEIFAGYPVYRTYFTDASGNSCDRDRIAVAAQRAVAAGCDRDLVAFLEAALAHQVSNADARELAFVAQQVTGAIVAKGDEDTTGYRLVRLAARCEVGSDPAVFAVPPEEVHRAFASSAPRTLLATSTHDTKRGEDVRARIAVLSEQPTAWASAVERWRARAEHHWGGVAPDRTLEYLLWQTLVGAWPIDAERACAYATKAAREARLRTSWRAPDAPFEEALLRWVRGVLADEALTGELAAFVERLAPRARANSLAQLALKLCAPGVPDIYQGCELADGSLVDPDNRRRVDFAERREVLRALGACRVEDLGTDLALGKLWTIRRILRLRRARPHLFTAPYRPLFAAGPRADRVFAFGRGDDLVCAVPRIGLVDPETSLTLAPGPWHDALSDRTHAGTVALAALWGSFPVAVLVREGPR